MLVEVVLNVCWDFGVVASLCTCKRLVHMCTCHSGVSLLVLSLVIHNDDPLRLKGQPCCRAIKMCRSVSAVVSASTA